MMIIYVLLIYKITDVYMYINTRVSYGDIDNNLVNNFNFTLSHQLHLATVLRVRT